MGDLSLYKKMLSKMESTTTKTRIFVSNTLQEKDYVKNVFFFLCHIAAFYR